MAGYVASLLSVTLMVSSFLSGKWWDLQLYVASILIA